MARTSTSLTWLFWLTILGSIFLLLLPLPHAIADLKPYWPILVLIFWELEAPGKVSLGLVVVLGLLVDFLHGYLLGEHVLRMLVVIYLVMRFRPRLRFFPMWQQVLAVWVLLMLDMALRLLIALVSGQVFAVSMLWLAPFVGALLWPFIFLFLDDLYTHLRVREA